MTRQKDIARLETLTEQVVADVLGCSLDEYAHQCHAASIAIVKSDLFEEARVARGSLHGIMGQHSWVVLGRDCYDPLAPILDVTAWSYAVVRQGEVVPRVWATTGAEGGHRPHGHGHILEWGRPCSAGGDPIPLSDEALDDLTPAAFSWVHLIGPLDARGWMALANAPVDGWPSDQIILAMHRTPQLRALIPVDRLGMLTDVNPGGLYLKTPEVVR